MLDLLFSESNQFGLFLGAHLLKSLDGGVDVVGNQSQERIFAVIHFAGLESFQGEVEHLRLNLGLVVLVDFVKG